MPSAPPLRTDYSSFHLRSLARKTKINNQSRRLLSLAAVLAGMNRKDAARLQGTIKTEVSLADRALCNIF